MCLSHDFFLKRGTRVYYCCNTLSFNKKKKRESFIKWDISTANPTHIFIKYIFIQLFYVIVQ